MHEIANVYVKTVFDIKQQKLGISMPFWPSMVSNCSEKLSKTTKKATKGQIKIDFHSLSMILLISKVEWL